MRTFRLAFLAAGLALATGCIVRTVPAHPLPPPPPRLITANEAVHRGDEYCHNHGWGCRLADVTLHGEVWFVNYDAVNPTVRGRLHLEIDGYTRNIVRADEPHPAVVVQPAPPPPPPPPAIRPMASDEAIRRGTDYCRARNYGCRLLDVDLAGNVWRVNFDAVSPFARGRLHLEFDALSRNLIRVAEPHPLPPGRPPRPMNSDEATRRGADFCRSRGYNCRFLDADFAGGRVWKLNYEVLGSPHGRLHIEFDAHTHALVDVNEDIRP